MSDSLRVLIADDHGVLRGGLIALLNTVPEIDIVGEAANGIEAIQKARALHPDVILMDLEMPLKSGVEAITELRQMEHKARILVLTSFGAEDMVLSALEAGADGYLLKDSSPQDLIQAIRDVYKGNAPLHPKIAKKLLHAYTRPKEVTSACDELTSRELEVLKLVAQGHNNKDIADRLVISLGTVKNHLTSIYSKLDVHSRSEATAWAWRCRLLRKE